MQETRKNRPARDYGTESGTDDVSPDRAPGMHGGDATEAEGWHQYRKWISTAPASSRTRRSGADPALYTWKGYRTWTEQVKRNWSGS